MSNLREEFEKLPGIKSVLIGMVFCYSKNQYIPKNKILSEVVAATNEVNLAWYAFQEQQKKIDAVLEFIDSDELGHDARLGDFYRDIEEFLK